MTQVATSAAAGDFGDLVARWDAIELRLETAEDNARKAGEAWLRDALDAAIKLEFSTIPPYLCALWSIEDQAAPAADSIRRIVQEEMLHMALACNMLVALGGTPRIAEPGFAPLYPGRLAGGVHAELEVGLAGLSDEVLRTFMIIELPEKPVQAETDELKSAAALDHDLSGHDTIGRFYDRLEVAFLILRPDFSTDRQIAGPLAWFPIRDLGDMHEAISLIKSQGEGATLTPLEHAPTAAGDVELAHFYRFLEIYARRRIEFLPDRGIWGFGSPLERPACYPMAPVPPGGHPGPGRSVPPQVAELLDRFDDRYRTLLGQLHRLWAEGDQGALVRAIDAMFSLEADARALMQIPIDPLNPSSGTYGPCFRPSGQSQ